MVQSLFVDGIIVEIRELAERVLFSANLEDKLAPAGDLTDERPGKAVLAPKSPERPSDLRIKRGGEMAHFPHLQELEQEEPRARLLHFFANHELLATELMALVLLRFPGAPKAFRRGVAKTLMEEQVHTNLYLDRMKALGCGFGSYPVTGYFWDVLKDMGSPLDYVAGLPLTFEQANLDFSRYFGGVFDTIGDEESKKLMDRIYRDEIRHVAYGLKWFRTWKQPEESDWEAYQNQLRLPLSPRRAKGTVYNVEGRKKSGFDLEFIQSLSVYSKSRGRCPSVFYFNPFVEMEMSRGRSFTPTKQQCEMQKDLETLPQFFGSEDDVVLVSRKPRLHWLLALSRVGMPVPEFEVLKDGAIDSDSELLGRKLGSFQPWALSSPALALAGPLSRRFQNLGEIAAFEKGGAKRVALFSKSTGAEFLREVVRSEGLPEWICPLEDVGSSISQENEARDTVDEWRNRGFERLIAKADYGAAGSRAIRLWERDLADSQLRWMEKVLRQEERLVIEPWHERVLDFSAHYDVAADGATFKGFVRMINDQRGQFLGASLASNLTAGLDAAIPKFLHGPEGNRYRDLYSRLGDRVFQRCREVGYEGPVGIDAYVYRQADGALRLKPVVEMNPRFTMGRMALSLRKWIAPGRDMALALLSPVQLRALELESFEALAEFLTQRFPLAVIEEPKRRLAEGAFCLTDATFAKQCVAVLFVGRPSLSWFVKEVAKQ